MAVLDHHDHPVASPGESACVVQFILTWVGFFAAIGLLSWVIAAL